MVTEKPDLSQEDLDRVNEYLNSPIHQIERPPFNPWFFVALTFGSVTGLLLLAMLVVRMSGIPV
jgi:hypothetical protein